MLLPNVILTVLALVYSGRALERIIDKPKSRTWMDWVEFGFFLCMGVSNLLACIGKAAG